MRIDHEAPGSRVLSLAAARALFEGAGALLDAALAFVVLLGLLAGCGARDAGGACSGGSHQPGALEIHHVALGQADATLVIGPTGRSLLVDAGEPVASGAEGALALGPYLEQVLGCRRLDEALITHFHSDHVGLPRRGGLWHLVDVQGVSIGRLLHRDVERFPADQGPTLAAWRRLLASGFGTRLRALVPRAGAPLDLGPGVEARVVAVDGAGVIPPGAPDRAGSPPNENDHSIAVRLRFGRFDYFIGGDLSGAQLDSPRGYAYQDVEVAVAAAVGDVDVLRANHHGSDHSSSPTFLAQLDPEVSIVSAGAGNRHGHPHPATVDRLLATSALYVTGSARAVPAAKVVGTIVVRTFDGAAYSVDGDPHAATDPPRVDADRDGYFIEADPDDDDPHAAPSPRLPEASPSGPSPLLSSSR